MFHVEHHLPKNTNNTLMSLGEIPGIRFACAIVLGFMRVSFILASVLNELS
jgi:hypothetical protein